MHSRLCAPVTLCLIIACNDASPVAPRAETPRSDLKAPVVLGRIIRNTIDPTGVLTAQGRHLVVTGPITCTVGERAELRVTVTQRATGAVAEGNGRVRCTGVDQQWEVRLQTTGRETFEEGDAIAVAFARTSDRGSVTDAHQWLISMTLTR